MTALLQVVGYIGTLIVGGLIGSFITNRLTIGRERQSGRDNRKRGFRSVVVRIREEARGGGIGAGTSVGNLTRSQIFAGFYRQKKPELRTAAANVESDFARKQRATFDQLVNTAANITDVEAMAGDGKKRVVESLDAIIKFLDESP
jgi:hypothetical protein